MSCFLKYPGNPVFGDKKMGTVFDVYLTQENKIFRMDFSYRKKKSLGVVFSTDGIHWSEPQITLEPEESTGWEDDINRNCVLKIDGIYRMWYTGQKDGKSAIGYAESVNGIDFVRKSREPVLKTEYDFEGESVMNPCVLYENGVYRMWYAAGETYEPNVIAYAESTDGIHWKKHPDNPIYTADKSNRFEQDRIGGCFVMKTGDMGYVMFYIGYEDIHTARICAACSPDGITGWKRSPYNPLIEPTKGEWDADACYKPSVLWNAESQKWQLWYNGRRGHDEFIGLAESSTRNLFE